ncbi:MAG TPA: helix-turn-helix domain-containing protein [Alphaproteobacteria bacterium]|jgi:AraC-like DNA-binding protein
MHPRAHDTALFSTDAVAPGERFAFWREAVCEVFVQLECERLGREPFVGAITTRPFGAVQLSEVAACPQHVVRSRRQIARTREDDLLVSVQLEGHGTIAQDGRTAALAVGDLCLYDSVRPYMLHFDGSFRQLVLQFPRAKLMERLGRPEPFTGIRVARDHPVGALASAFLSGLGRDSAAIPPPAAERLAGTALDLLATALATARGATARAEARRSAALAHAKMLTMARLDDPALEPGAVAVALGVATRSLHRLFEAEGTSFMRWVLEQRLAGCRRDLTDPLQSHRSISDIALGRGFADLSHFSRAFRQRYGAAARDVRAAGCAGRGQTS